MNKLLKLFLVPVLGLLFVAPQVQAATYGIDESHTTIGFAVKHLLIAKTRGKFSDYTGEIMFDPADLDSFKAEANIKVASIDTDNEARDKHLRSPDFFAVEEYPDIKFMSTKIQKDGGENNYVMTGDLTIRDVTKTIELPVSISGPIQNPFGEGQVIAIAGETIINRQDFNVSWNKSLDQGGFVLDDEVKLVIEIEAHEK